MNTQLKIPPNSSTNSSPLIRIKNTCPSFEYCSAAHCPKTQQGLHMAGDEVCIKTGRAWAKNFHSENPDVSSGEAMAIITARYDKRNPVASREALSPVAS